MQREYRGESPGDLQNREFISSPESEPLSCPLHLGTGRKNKPLGRDTQAPARPWGKVSVCEKLATFVLISFNTDLR